MPRPTLTKDYPRPSPNLWIDPKGNFWVKGRVGGKPVEKKIGPRRTVADKWIERQEGKALQARLFPEEAKPAAYTVAELFARYRQEDENKNKTAWANSLVEDRWVEILGETTLASDLTVGHVTAQQAAWLAEGLAGSSINRYCARLRRCLQQATRDGLLRFNPVLGYPQLREPPARHRRLEVEEEERLRKVMAPHDMDLVDFALLSGFREDEMFSCRRDFVSVPRREIHLPDTKGIETKSRTIAMSNRLLELTVRLLERSEDSVWLFPSRRRSTPLGAVNWIKRRLYPALEAAGIEGLRFHDFRRTCATRFALQGASTAAIKEYLGHEQSSTTDRYLSMAGANLHRLAALQDRDL